MSTIKPFKLVIAAVQEAKKPKDPIAQGKAYSAKHFYPYFEKYPKAFANVYCGADCGKGWLHIIEPIVAMCDVENMEIHQIKEKFGGIRIYTDQTHPVIDEMIRRAEEACWKTCERCGAEGKKRPGGWIKVFCDRCEEERKTRTWNDGWWDDV